MSVKKIYISGKISDNPGYREQFKAAEKMLGMTLSGDWEIVNPAEIYPGVDGEALDRDEWMVVDKAILGICDAIFMIPGWEDSPGAKEEYELAKEIGLPIHGWGGTWDTVFYAGDKEVYRIPGLENIKVDVTNLTNVKGEE